MEATESYVHKKEVDWSLLHEGLTLPVANRVVFGRVMDRFLARGESKSINLYFSKICYYKFYENWRIFKWILKG